MNTDQTDSKLRHLFNEARNQDALRAPPFGPLVRVTVRARETMPRFTLLRFSVAASAAVLVILGVSLALFYTTTRQPAAVPEQWAALSNWRAPSDGLLNVSSMPWGGEIVTWSDSWIATTSFVPDTNQTNGKEIL
jgi:hypothetical protein